MTCLSTSSLILVVAAAAALLATGLVSADQQPEIIGTFCQSATCEPSKCQKTVGFPSGACASWNKGTSQMMVCNPDSKTEALAFPGLKYNASSPGGKSCSSSTPQAVVIPCDECLPDSARPGEFIIVRGCKTAPKGWVVKMGCDPQCKNCKREKELSLGACIEAQPGDASRWRFPALPKLMKSNIKLAQWTTSETCDGVPTNTQSIFDDACLGEGADGVSLSYSCRHTRATDDEKAHPQPVPQNRQGAAAAAADMDAQVFQCNPICNASSCKHVATYYSGGCIKYGAGQRPIEFRCQAASAGEDLCVNIGLFNSSLPAECMPLNLQATGSQRCGVCKPADKGGYERYGNCTDRSNFGITHCDDAQCSQNCVYSKLPLDTCVTAKPGVNILWFALGKCDANVEIDLYAHDANSCGGIPVKRLPSPAGGRSCSFGRSGPLVGTNYKCVPKRF